MDTINQSKLCKEEWETIEKPCNNSDKIILKFLEESYQNPDKVLYKYCTLQEFLKVNEECYDEFIYKNILHNYIEKLDNKYEKILSLNKNYISAKQLYQNKNKKNNVVCKKKILIKIESSKDKVKSVLEEISIKDLHKNVKKSVIIEVNLFILAISLMHNLKHRKSYYVSMFSYLIKKMVTKYQKTHNLNTLFMNYYNNILYFVEKHINLKDILKNYQEFVIKNIEKDEQIKLYEHQKELISYYKNSFEKSESCGSFIMYSAPTGSGKTMTPIGLVHDYKVIFICAARHVGLTLANYMINMGKKVAFAFGCNKMEDIRLHFNAVSDYIQVQKNGKKIKLPDHMVGDKVEIIISDIQSYYHSMLYMMSFNNANDMILYWDEPTISMDYETHELHSDIENVFKNNKIPNIILSSASLPEINQIPNVIESFKNKFPNKNINILEIKSNMNQNSVSIYDDCGNVMMPHHLWLNDDDKLNKCIQYLEKRIELQKFLSVNECINFIQDVDKYLSIDVLSYQEVIENILPVNVVMINNMHIFKIYLYLLSMLRKNKREQLYNHYITKNEMNKLKTQQIYLTSVDSFTITGGPCLYLTNSPSKLISMLFKTSTIPEDMLHALMKIVKDNEIHMAVINKNMKLFEDAMRKELDKERKMEAGKMTPQAEKINKLIETTRAKLKSVSLQYEYIPNYKEHFNKFHKNLSLKDYELWRSQIDEDMLEKILNIDKLDPIFKLTLMIGIGILHKDLPSEYTYYVKELTNKQKLFMVIADEDYVYGTNYQFCHGYIGKDLTSITQEKLVQSMGRIGRKNMNKEYTFRLRDNNLFERIFIPSQHCIEVDNMNKLFH